MMTTTLMETNGRPETALVELSAKESQQMTLPGFKSTATGLVANKTLSVGQWEDAGKVLGHIEQRLSWYLGDWITARREGDWHLH